MAGTRHSLVGPLWVISQMINLMCVFVLSNRSMAGTRNSLVGPLWVISQMINLSVVFFFQTYQWLEQEIVQWVHYEWSITWLTYVCFFYFRTDLIAYFLTDLLSNGNIKLDWGLTPDALRFEVTITVTYRMVAIGDCNDTRSSDVQRVTVAKGSVRYDVTDIHPWRAYDVTLKMLVVGWNITDSVTKRVTSIEIGKTWIGRVWEYMSQEYIQARWLKCESVETPTTSVLSCLNLSMLSLNAMISVGHTNVPQLVVLRI